MKRPSVSADYFRERGQEALQWAIEAGDNSPFREGFARIAGAWFEAAAHAELAEAARAEMAGEAPWADAEPQAEEPASFH